ncbi:MAG: carbohydrate ABC transporter permease [Chloroflexi bacterium]|nr:carbohydrate ABC transporter permease [Chloroflexota bacterium]MCI0574981.1 carbohydrate ABC transporter permease [Chloroflexota bacterium]MCI0648445.1 carbohydrate ABC transporter permease [Chloroflexota bacterium]MCI0727587.1 carbohydrate ABC transporter permease [Chloroflexota bacterium]
MRAVSLPKVRRPIPWSTILVYTLLLLGTIVVLYPFFYMVMNSVKPGREILHRPTSLPSEITFSGYAGVFERLNMALLFRNSFVLATSITLLNTSLSALAAYAIAKIPFPGRNYIFSFMLTTMMIPTILFLVPTYVLMYNLGWVGHFHALIIPAAVTVFNIFLLRQFMLGIPNELIEAARLDGASEFTIFLRVILPLARPALATVAILNFMGSWNDFFGPLLYLNTPDKWTVQLGLLQFRSSVPGENAQQVWAATTLITLPLIAAFIFLQDQFMRAFANVSFK